MSLFFLPRDIYILDPVTSRTVISRYLGVIFVTSRPYRYPRDIARWDTYRIPHCIYLHSDEHNSSDHQQTASDSSSDTEIASDDEQESENENSEHEISYLTEKHYSLSETDGVNQSFICMAEGRRHCVAQNCLSPRGKALVVDHVLARHAACDRLRERNRLVGIAREAVVRLSLGARPGERLVGNPRTRRRSYWSGQPVDGRPETGRLPRAASHRSRSQHYVQPAYRCGGRLSGPSDPADHGARVAGQPEHRRPRHQRRRQGRIEQVHPVIDDDQFVKRVHDVGRAFQIVLDLGHGKLIDFLLPPGRLRRQRPAHGRQARGGLGQRLPGRARGRRALLHRRALDGRSDNGNREIVGMA